MKKLYLLILIIVNSISLFAQDVGISGSFLPPGIPVGSRTTCTVVFTNNDAVQIPADGVWIQINFPPQYTACRPPSGTLTEYFKTFSYDPVYRVWFGHNTKPIPANNQGFSDASFIFEVTGNEVIGMNDATLFDTDFEIMTDKNPSDNQATAGLVVNSAKPVEIISFKAESKECGKIVLTWNTDKEINNDFIEIQSSIDGKNFTLAGKIEGMTGSEGNAYILVDEFDFISGTKYYYKIIQVDNDGIRHEHEVIEILYICKLKDPQLHVYPNPASDKIYIFVSDIKPQQIKAVISDRRGINLKEISFISSVPYELNLKDLPSGVFKIQTQDTDQPMNCSFVRIK